MNTIFHDQFLDDLAHWVKEDRRVALKIFKLLKAVRADPKNGIGKPERLKYIHQNMYSRRITQEHRLVYLVYEDRIEFIQCRYHY